MTRKMKVGWEHLLGHILHEEKPFTTFEVSKMCGVGHTTVSYWVDEGKLPAYRTPGGHRRITREDLLGFLKQYRIPVPRRLEQMADSVLEKETVIQ